MMKTIAKWYLRKYTTYLWDVYNEGFIDGIEQTRLDMEEEE